MIELHSPIAPQLVYVSVVLTAVLPILLLLTGGAVLRRRVLTEEGFWRGLAWLSYWVFTPALFISSIGTADLSVVPPGPLLASLAAPILAVTGMTFLLARLVRANGPQLTSMVQGSIRINTYIGLVFASALHGREGVATFALASAVVVPLVNLICVSTLAARGEPSGQIRRVRLWRELVQNPLILSCAAGLAVNLLPVSMPELLTTSVEMIAAPALVCGTLLAGAALRFTFRRRDLLDISIATILKLALLPLTALGIALMLGVSGPTLTSIVLITAVPTAPSAYVLALRMGGDTRLIAAITGVQTILATATMPALLALTEQLTR